MRTRCYRAVEVFGLANPDSPWRVLQILYETSYDGEPRISSFGLAEHTNFNLPISAPELPLIELHHVCREAQRQSRRLTAVYEVPHHWSLTRIIHHHATTYTQASPIRPDDRKPNGGRQVRVSKPA